MNPSEPLTTWWCDKCGEAINTVGEGYVVWRVSDTKNHDFRIVHQGRCDPGSGRGYTHSLALEDFVGEVGHARLLGFLSSGPLKGEGPRDPDRPLTVGMNEFIDFFRRAQTPYYEEARRSLFNRSDVQDEFGYSNEHMPYIPDVMKRALEEFSSEEL